MALVDFNAKSPGVNKLSQGSNRVSKQKILEARSLAIAECASLKQIVDVIALETGAYTVCELTGVNSVISRAVAMSTEHITALLDGNTPEGMTAEDATVQRAKLFKSLFDKLDKF